MVRQRMRFGYWAQDALPLFRYIASGVPHVALTNSGPRCGNRGPALAGSLIGQGFETVGLKVLISRPRRHSPDITRHGSLPQGEGEGAGTRIRRNCSTQRY